MMRHVINQSHGHNIKNLEILVKGDLVHRYLLKLSQESQESHCPLFNYLDGLVTNFPLEQARQENSLFVRIFRFLILYPCDWFVMQCIIFDPGCPNLSYQSLNLVTSIHFRCLV